MKLTVVIQPSTTSMKASLKLTLEIRLLCEGQISLPQLEYELHMPLWLFERLDGCGLGYGGKLSAS